MTTSPTPGTARASKYQMFTPEQVSEETGGQVTAYQIRTLARKGLIEHTRASGQKILLTEAQVDGLMAYLTAPARPAAEPEAPTEPTEPAAPRSPAEIVSRPASDPFGGSRRSKSARRTRVRA